MDSIKAIKTDVSAVVARSVTSTFVTMFRREVAQAAAGDGLGKSAGPEICSCASLWQDGRVKMDFTFHFDRALLDAIARDAYTEEELAKPLIREDIACAVANIVCSNVKTWFNGRGYALDMNIPFAGPAPAAEGRECAFVSFSHGGNGRGILVNIQMQDNRPGKERAHADARP